MPAKIEKAHAQIIRLHRNKHSYHRHHRSLDHQHDRHHLSKTKKQSNAVIHGTIRSSHSMGPTYKKSIDQKSDKTHLTSTNIESRYDDQQLKISSFGTSSGGCSKNSQSIWKIHNDKRNSRNKSNCSTRIDSNSTIIHQIITKGKKSHFQSSTVAPYKNTRNNDFANMKKINHNSDAKDIVSDHHRKSKKHKNKKCTRRCVFMSIVGCLLLSSTIIITLVIIFLKKPNQSTNTKSALLRWNSAGITLVGITGVLGSASNQLNSPWDLVVDWSYSLYVSDRSNHRVQKFVRGSTTGVTLAGNGTLGSSANALSLPCGIYIDINDNVYIADRNNHRIQFWTNGASFGSTIVGNGTPGTGNNQLDYPYGLRGDSNTGMLYIAEHNNHRISSYRFSDSSTNIVAGGNGPGLNNTQLWYPHGFCFDPVSSSFLVANTVANNIVRWKLGASSWTLIAGDINGSSGNTSVLLNFPTGITIDPMGNIYVAERYSHRIQLFIDGESNGKTIAGVAGISGNNSTLLKGPISLALDGQLNLYVVDQNNHRVQKFYRY